MLAKYQDVESELTLEQGLSEYRALNPDLEDARKMTLQGTAFFECHDVAHVVFACDTSLLNEAMADAWTLFGTSVSLRQFLDFMKIEEHKNIIAKLGWPTVIATFVKALPYVFLIALRSATMTRRWPWESFSAYLSVPLAEIRREFHIRPIVVA